jgi:hypothetical protein
MPTTKNTKTNQSKKSSTTPSKTQAPAPAASTVNSTAEQTPAPQANQASTVILNTAAATPAITGPANGSNNGTKTSLQTSYAALIAGLSAYYQPGDVLQLPTGDETRDEVIADLQKFVQAAEDTKAAYLAWRAAVQNERTIELALRPEKQAVQSVVIGRFGRASTTLLKFGIPPRVPVVKTIAEKAEANAKSEATRKARGTTSKKKKLAVSGNVTGVIITPVTSTANVASVPTPATAPAAETPAVAPAAPAVKPAS